MYLCIFVHNFIFYSLFVTLDEDNIMQGERFPPLIASDIVHSPELDAKLGKSGVYGKVVEVLAYIHASKPSAKL